MNMNWPMFDTHKYVKKLIKAGFTEKQAETMAEEQNQFVTTNFVNTHFATKKDFEELKQDIMTVKNNIHRDIKELELRMFVKLGTLLVVALSVFTTITTVIVKFL